MKPLVFCAFPPCWYVDVCRFVFRRWQSSFWFLKRGKEGRKEQRFSVSEFVFNAPPPILIWTLPNLLVAPHGLTQSSEQRWLFSSKCQVFFYVRLVFHTWTGEKVPDLFCVWSFPLLLRHVGSYSEGFFSSYSQNRVTFRCAEPQLVFVLLLYLLRWRFHTDSGEQTLSFTSARCPDTERKCSTAFFVLSANQSLTSRFTEGSLRGRLCAGLFLITSNTVTVWWRGCIKGTVHQQMSILSSLHVDIKS